MKKFKPIVNNIENTIEKLIKNEVSMSKYGDGEFSLMNGESLKFQKYDEELKIKLINIINSNLSNHIVCIPDIFHKQDIFTEKAQKYWRNYLEKKYIDYFS